MNEQVHVDQQELFREAGRRAAAMRRIVTGECAVCGRTITGTTKRRYCSSTCRARATRQRQREQEQGQRVQGEPGQGAVSQ